MSNRRFKVDALNVRVYPDPDSLAQAAAQQVIIQLQQTLQHQPQATIVFATGRSQLGLLGYLRRDTTVDWSRVIGFHLDEFLGLSREHPASFGAYLHHHIVRWLPFQVFNYLNGDALEPIEECDRYTQLLTQKPIDICLLGIGDNGHLAFNDPAVADFHDSRWVKLVRLDNINRQQQLTSGYFPQLSAVPAYAITLSLSAIRSARYNLCCVFGDYKADVLKTVLTVSPSEACPASILRLDGKGKNTLFIDEPACRLFSNMT
ncbi:glucosamine-6-phosphate deaminase [Leptolyngbyaceae cyanobacterium CCMR0082]|uniref:Glucosamine-6-phosphate deaminase n=2 Tax=Adonisia turfae TaxID=2950184 RepID=A0A6M0S0J8_9CYAN|nr:6-phosphogluconolactonase [Adonisia turfae]NEZ57097.1 glucosamine-6-phosphate deaminase [Adonisia turfae CCMR0081]NEZ61653.1 glucosamine-6-phosphate deaminase [Adonisia turfae CCMR0082]